VNPLPCLDKGYVTFGALTRAARINHRVIGVWSRILHGVPRSKLRIDSLNFRDDGLRVSLASRFAAHGIESDRLLMGYQSPPWDVMRQIDIGLDSFPQNSGTTLFENLYMGIPFITLKDRPSLGRLGASIATHSGHEEWIADSESGYIDKAIMLASDLAGLSAIRAGLRSQMERSVLMNEAGYVSDVEQAYRSMWRKWCVQTK
jgi:protein O-GlcNAc transferase